MAIKLTDDFDIRGEYWDELVESVEWVVEVDATKGGVTYCMAPTKREREYSDGHATKQRYRTKHPDPERGPLF